MAVKTVAARKRKLTKREKAAREKTVRGGLLVACTAVSLWIISAFAWPAFADHPYFKLKSVRVSCDSEAADPRRLAARAGLYAGTSVWRLDLEGAIRELESDTWVERVDLERRLPAEVRLRVLRKRPVAATMLDSGPWLVDESGAVYRGVDRSALPDIPWVTGWQDIDSRGARVNRLRAAVAVVHEANARELPLSQVNLDADGEVWLYLDGYLVSIRLGLPGDSGARLNRLSRVLGELGSGLEQVSHIDLAMDGVVVVKARGGKIRALSATLASRARSGGPGTGGGRG
ncbi:MAG: FtsQ-type POTRA domain-containing protein [bacterium]